MKSATTNKVKIQDTRIWKVRSRKDAFEWKGPLVAVWEVSLDPISDRYTADEISAEDLLREWLNEVTEKFPNGLVPIHWFVDSPGHGKLESMPFQLEHYPDLYREDFLTHYHWPVDAKTGEPLNWLTIPVVDKLWNKTHADKSGFIQEATGWKPSVLQPYVYLQALINSREG